MLSGSIGIACTRALCAVTATTAAPDPEVQ